MVDDCIEVTDVLSIPCEMAKLFPQPPPLPEPLDLPPPPDNSAPVEEIERYNAVVADKRNYAMAATINAVYEMAATEVLRAAFRDGRKLQRSVGVLILDYARLVALADMCYEEARQGVFLPTLDKSPAHAMYMAYEARCRDLEEILGIAGRGD